MEPIGRRANRLYQCFSCQNHGSDQILPSECRNENSYCVGQFCTLTWHTRVKSAPALGVSRVVDRESQIRPANDRQSHRRLSEHVHAAAPDARLFAALRRRQAGEDRMCVPGQSVQRRPAHGLRGRCVGRCVERQEMVNSCDDLCDRIQCNETIQMRWERIACDQRHCTGLTIRILFIFFVEFS